MKNQRLIVALTLAALLVGGWGLFALSAWTSRGGQSAPLYSTRRYDPYGTAALQELLTQRGKEVNTLERPWLPRDAKGVLIQVLAQQQMVFRQPRPNAAALREWIAQGNTVVQFVCERSDLMDECNVPGKPAMVALPTRPGAPAGAPKMAPGVVFDGVQQQAWKEIEKHMAQGKPPDGLANRAAQAHWLPARGGDTRFEGLPNLELIAPTELPAGDGAWTPLAKTSSGQVAAGVLHHGQGKLIVIASPTVPLNGFLSKPGHVEAVLKLIGDEPVWLDEWSHGIGTGGTVIALIREAGLLPALLQLGFLIVLYGWSQMSQRRREIPVAQRRRSSREQVITLGHLYSKVLAPGDMLERVQREVKRRVAGALRCSPMAIEHRLETCRDPEMVKAARELLATVPAPPVKTHPRCRQCGYDLRGNVTGKCSECGAPVTPEQRRAIDALGGTGAGAIADPEITNDPVLQRRAAVESAWHLTRAFELGERARERKHRLGT